MYWNIQQSDKSKKKRYIFAVSIWGCIAEKSKQSCTFDSWKSSLTQGLHVSGLGGAPDRRAGLSSIKMIDPSPQRGQLKFMAPELNSRFGVKIFCWWQVNWCLLMSFWWMGRRPLGTEDRARSNCWNHCFTWTSAKSSLWMIVQDRHRGRESVLIITE